MSATLTPYDTGARLQPFPWHTQPANLPDPEEAKRYGRVDFDNDEGFTAFTVYAQVNEQGGYTLHIENINVDLRIERKDDDSR